MRICTKENFKFTSKYLWAAFLLSVPLFFLAGFEIVNPHRDMSGWLFLFSVVAGFSLIITSLLKKERQIIFMFIDVVFVIFNALACLICH